MQRRITFHYGQHGLVPHSKNVDEAFHHLAQPFFVYIVVAVVTDRTLSHNAKRDQHAGIGDIMRKEIPVARFMHCEHKPAQRKICKSIENE